MTSIQGKNSLLDVYFLVVCKSYPFFGFVYHILQAVGGFMWIHELTNCFLSRTNSKCTDQKQGTSTNT